MNKDLLLLKLALRDARRPGAVLASLLLVGLPALLGLIHVQMRRFTHTAPEVGYDLLAGLLVFGFSLVILAVVHGTSIVSQEMEQKTIVFLLTRPVPRYRVLLARFLAAAFVVTCTVCLSTVLLALLVFGPDGLSRPQVQRDLTVLPLGALAYTSLFALLSTFLQRPLIYGLGFAFGWESWVPFMPGSFRHLSVMTYVRALAAHQPPEDLPNRMTALLNLLNPTQIAPGAARLVLFAIIGVCLGLALWIFSHREYVPADAAE